MMTIFTEIDEFDGAKDGFVMKDEFRDAFVKTLGTELLLPIDYEYLSKKYRAETATTKEEEEQVVYLLFYQDYAQMNEEGIDGKVDGLKEG